MKWFIPQDQRAKYIFSSQVLWIDSFFNLTYILINVCQIAINVKCSVTKT